MENKPIAESGFKIVQITLLECHFLRVPNVLFEADKIKHDINIEVSHQINDNIISVVESLRFKQLFNDEEQISATINISGLFERFGETAMTMEQFGNVNGPAIIFPYIREQLSSLTLKAGLGQILLPPLNFTLKNQVVKKE